MLVVKVELWPHGIEALAEEIGRANIGNDGTAHGAIGNYNISFTTLEREGDGDRPPFYPKEQRAWAALNVRVEGFPRLKLGVWDLLHRALLARAEQQDRQADLEEAVQDRLDEDRAYLNQEYADEQARLDAEREEMDRTHSG